MQKFVILTTQRTGSSVLFRYLDQHPDINACGEIFLQLRRKNRVEGFFTTYRRSSLKNKMLYYLNRKQLIDTFLQNFFSQKKDVKVTGFKLMYDQIDNNLLGWLKENDVKVIHLIRNNTLKMIISRLTAKKRNLYHIEKEDKIATLKVSLRPKKTIKRIRKNLHQVDMHRKIIRDMDSIEVYYEDISNDLNGLANRIYRFLELSCFECENIPLKKINSDNLETLVENYHEIYQAFSGTEYEKYLSAQN